MNKLNKFSRGKKLVFKISQASDEEHVKNILEFAHYMGSRGIRISSPNKNENATFMRLQKMEIIY